MDKVKGGGGLQSPEGIAFQAEGIAGMMALSWGLHDSKEQEDWLVGLEG